jgi:hypothetical protein
LRIETASLAGLAWLCGVGIITMNAFYAFDSDEQASSCRFNWMEKSAGVTR